MARLSLHSFYPGSDVRGYSGYGHMRYGPLRLGAVVSQSSSPAELRARMQKMVDALWSQWGWIKAKIIAGDVAASYFSAGYSTNTAGLQTIDNAISLKTKSISDVLGGQLTLEKWINGVEVLRTEIDNYARYVNGSASARANLAQLARDLRNTAADYGAAVWEGAKKASAGIAIGTGVLAILAGIVIWKVGVPIAQAWLSPPRLRG